jgi:hypothetical protein
MTEETEENAGASEDSSMSFAAAEARKALIEEMGDSGFARPAGMQNSAHAVLKDIQPMRELFQPREEYESHVKDLMDALKVHGELDPILVGHTGKRTVLIEGHHRHTAYKRSGYLDEPVAVEWFEGSVDEAVCASMMPNTKHKLPMVLQERLNAAWRLIRLGTFSKSRITKVTTVGDGQIARMRRVLKAHRDDVIGVEQWSRASKIATGRGTVRTEDEHEAWLEGLVETYQEKVRRAVGNKLASNPDMMARVLARYCGNNLPAVFHSAKQLGLLEIDEDEFSDSDF